MSRQETLTLAHPLVRALKSKWDKQTHRVKLSFEDLFERFKTEEVTNLAVAKEAGISRQGIVQIYNRYFRRLFGNKTREKRRNERMPYRHKLKLLYATQVAIQSKVLAPIAEAARQAMCKVKVVPAVIPGTVKWSRLFINDQLCSIHRLNKGTKTSPRAKILYTKASVSTSTLDEVAYVIFHVKVHGWPHRFFVVPTSLIREKFSIATERDHWHLYIPLWEQPRYKNIAAKINFFEYENLWPKK